MRYSKVGDQLNSIGLESPFVSTGIAPAFIAESLHEIAHGPLILPKALVGGFHLIDASSEVLAKTTLAMDALHPGAVFCSRCADLPGYAAFHGSLPGKVSWLSCGMQANP
jgi:metal-dependent hydrolase (beta-lactamase superfamily II)